MRKDERQRAIVELIRNKEFRRQDEVANELKLAGFHVTQASVSRDLDELRIVKANGVYTVPDRFNGNTPFGIASVDISGESLLVAKCAAGLASAAAVSIDAAGLDDIVGTIAGDDTIFVAVKDRDGQKRVLRQLIEMFSGNEGNKR